jgi:hypothetical protein
VMDWAAAKCGAATKGRAAAMDWAAAKCGAATKGCAAVVDWAAAKTPPWLDAKRGAGAKREWAAKRGSGAAAKREATRGPPECRLRLLLPLPLPRLLLPLPLPRLRSTKAVPSKTSNAADKRGTRGNGVTCERARCTASDFRGGRLTKHAESSAQLVVSTPQDGDLEPSLASPG